MKAGEWQPQAGLQVQLSTPSGRRLSLRSSFLNGERCSRSSERKKGRHELLHTLRVRPSILITAFVIFAVCTTVGVLATWLTARSQTNAAREQARAQASDAMSAVRAQLVGLTQLVAGTMSYIEAGVGMNYTQLQSIFPKASATLLSKLTPPVQGAAVNLLPQGVSLDIYPVTQVTTAYLGMDMLQTPLAPVAFAAIMSGQVMVVGPYKDIRFNVTSVFMYKAIVMQGVAANETFQQPVAGPSNCPVGVCYQPATNSKFWGMVIAGSTLTDILYYPEGPLPTLEAHGYNYRLYQANSPGLPPTPGLPNNGSLMAKSAEPVGSPESFVLEFSDAVTGFAPWTLEVSPVGGWGVAWEQPLYAVVGVVSLLIAIGFSFLQISRFQNQMLLYSLVPKHLVAELKRRSSYVDYKADDAFEFNTPAEVMLSVLSGCLQGTLPDPATIVQLRAALLNLQDIYRPSNISEQLKAAHLDDEVADALFGLIGKGNAGGPDNATHRALDNPIGNSSAHPDQGGDEGDFKAVLANMLRGTLEPNSQHRRASAIWHTTIRDSKDQPASPHALQAPIPGAVQDPTLTDGSLIGVGGDLSAHNRLTGSSAADPLRSRNVSESGFRTQIKRFSTLLTFRQASSKEEDLETAAREASVMPEKQEPAAQEITPAVVDRLNGILEQAYTNWTFDAFALSDASFGRPLSTLGYALIHRSGLMEQLKLKPVKVAKFLQSLENGYMDNPYHCKTHAADVLQTYHVILVKGGFLGTYLDPIRHLACYMAAASHDVEHEGLTNDYLINTESMLALRYNDRSPMENHHLAAMYSLLKLPGNNFVSHLAKEARDMLRKSVIELVLGTDMKQHLTITSQFKSVHKKTLDTAEAPPLPKHPPTLGKSFSMRKALGSVKFPSNPGTVIHPMPVIEEPETREMAPMDDTERLLSLQVALKIADLGHLAEDEDVHRMWVSRLEEEFFRQGDRERERGLPISPLFDRNKPGVTKSQVGFFDFVATPLFKMFTTVFPLCKPLMDCLDSNYLYWKEAANEAANTVEQRSGPSHTAGSMTSNAGAPRTALSGKGAANGRKPTHDTDTSHTTVTPIEHLTHQHDDVARRKSHVAFSADEKV